MATPRRLNAALELTPYFHCTSRCVRGGFLCGVDRTTGQNYTHRRRWLKKRLLKLSEIFAIKIAAFAIMENHFHVVLKVEKNTANQWSNDEIIQRWHKLFKGNRLSQRHMNSETLSPIELKELSVCIQRWRCALHDISWFMRCAKEPLARRSNREDNCKGRFWEGRFHSQVLLDTRAVLACMAYVDLNPLRARLCKSPEDDPFTSLYYRAKTISDRELSRLANLPPSMIDLDRPNINDNHPILAVSTAEYLQLVDLTARQSKPEKKGTLPDSALPILARLGIHDLAWQDLERSFNRNFHALVGCGSALRKACQILGQKYAWGRRHCEAFFGESSMQP